MHNVEKGGENWEYDEEIFGYCEAQSVSKDEAFLVLQT